MDFIRQFISLIEEKTSKLDENQRHLREGLKSLKKTGRVVTGLKKELAVFDVELEAKNKAANEKLELIIEKKKEAAEKVKDSKSLSEKIKKKRSEIDARNKKVNLELMEVKPALEKAKSSVSSIKSSQLGEIRNYKVPPKRVQLCMTAVMLLITGKKMNWDEVKKQMARKDFIESVLNFNIDDTSERV